MGRGVLARIEVNEKGMTKKGGKTGVICSSGVRVLCTSQVTLFGGGGWGVSCGHALLNTLAMTGCGGR